MASLNNLIREVQPQTAPGPGERLIIIRTSDGEILSRVPLFNRSPCRFFLVRSGDTVALPETRYSIDQKSVAIGGRVQLQPMREALAVQWLFRSGDFQQSFIESIGQWVQDQVHTFGYLDSYSMADYLARKANDHGVSFQAEIQVIAPFASEPPPRHSYRTSTEPRSSHSLGNTQGVTNESPFETGGDRFGGPRQAAPKVSESEPETPLHKPRLSQTFELETHFQDYPDELSLEVHLKYEDSPVLSNPAQLRQLEITVSNSICGFCVGEVSVIEFLYQREKTARRILRQLVSQFDHQGLRIKTLKLTGMETSLPPDFKTTLDKVFTYHVGLIHKHELKVYTRVNFTLENIAACFGSGHFSMMAFEEKDFLAWAEKTMDRFLGDYLVNVPFAQIEERKRLLLDKENGSLALQLQQASSRIGFVAKLLEIQVILDLNDVPQNFDDFIKVNHELINHEAIEIDNRVRMNLTDRQRYIERGYPKLKEWAEHQLKSIIGRHLFTYDYASVVLHFDDQLKSTIEAELQREARNIGYEVDILTISPELAPFKWREGLEVVVKRRFETSMAGQFIGVGIHASFSIPDLSHPKIKPFITSQDTNIREAIEQAMTAELRALIHQLDPVRFYSAFNNTFDYTTVRAGGNEHGRSGPLKNELEDLVRKYLEEQFFARVKIVSAKQLEDDVLKLLDEVKRKVIPFEFKVNPRNSIDTVKVCGNIQLGSVTDNGWNIFLKKAGLRLVQMVDHLKDYLVTILEKRERVDLLCENEQDHEMLVSDVNRLIHGYSSKQFGLVMELSHIRLESDFRKPKEMGFGRKRYVAELERRSSLIDFRNIDKETELQIYKKKQQHRVDSLENSIKKVKKLENNVKYDPDADERIRKWNEEIAQAGNPESLFGSRAIKGNASQSSDNEYQEGE